MSKKKNVKLSSKRKPPSRAVAAGRKVELGKNEAAKDVIAEVEAEGAGAVEVTAKMLPEAEPAAAVAEASQQEEPAAAVKIRKTHR